MQRCVARNYAFYEKTNMSGQSDQGQPQPAKHVHAEKVGEKITGWVPLFACLGLGAMAIVMILFGAAMGNVFGTIVIFAGIVSIPWH